MTAPEHAKVWRMAAKKLQPKRYNFGHIAWLIADAVAISYEQSAKEQEGRERGELGLVRLRGVTD